MKKFRKITMIYLNQKLIFAYVSFDEVSEPKKIEPYLLDYLSVRDVSQMED